MARGTATADYIMEDPREAMRLELKVDPYAWVQKNLAGRIRGRAEVLSVGCGPGVIFFVCGDAQAMDFGSNSFDLVYSRMLMEYLKDKEGAVKEMVRVCKPGGTVLLQDLDGQLLWHYPEDPVVQGTVEKVVRALSSTGFDPFVGRKLFSLAHGAGLKNIDVQVECYHLIAGQIEPAILEQWELKLEIAGPQLARLLGSEREGREQSRRFLEYLCRPDTLTYSTVFTVSGEKV